MDMVAMDRQIEEMWKHRCSGQSEDYKVILQGDKWLVLDVGGDHVIPIVFCPYCGLKLVSSDRGARLT